MYPVSYTHLDVYKRQVLVEVETGNIVAQAVKPYTHGVMDEYLPDGRTKLPMDWALQHPADYMEVVEITIPEVLKAAGIDGEDVIGLSTDFTACTILPTDKNGEPLCYKEDLKSEPHAYVKLWKHHAAQPEANKITEIAEQRGETFLNRYGGKISSEWMEPKVLQILNEAPGIYARAEKIMEVGDWVNSVSYTHLWAVPWTEDLQNTCGYLAGCYRCTPTVCTISRTI